jgi:hypothetical protein
MTRMSIPPCRQMQNMMDSPQFLQQMSTLLSDPRVMDQLASMDSTIGGLDPQMRQVFQSEQFRQMVFVEPHCESLSTILSHAWFQVEPRHTSNDAANVPPDDWGRIYP